METEQQEETFTNTETNGNFFKGLFYFGGKEAFSVLVFVTILECFNYIKCFI